MNQLRGGKQSKRSDVQAATLFSYLEVQRYPSPWEHLDEVSLSSRGNGENTEKPLFQICVPRVMRLDLGLKASSSA